MVCAHVAEDLVEELLLSLCIVFIGVAPAQRRLQFEHEVAEVLDLYVAGRVGVEHRPGVLEEGKHPTIHTLRFEVPRLNVSEESDGNEEVRRPCVWDHY